MAVRLPLFSHAPRVNTVSRLIACIVVLSAVGRLGWGAPAVKVAGDRVNLRAAPTARAEVVTQVQRGQRLATTGTRRDGWVQVVPPQGTIFWVYAQLIRDGVVGASRLNVRSGPGISYHSVGQLQKGAPVESLGSMGEWTKIPAPPGCFLWISETYVTGASAVAPPVVAAVAPASDGTPSPAPRVAVAAAPVPAERLPQTRSGQTAASGRRPRAAQPARNPAAPGTVKVTGVVRPLGVFAWGHTRSYRLVNRDERGRSVTTCALEGDDAMLSPWVGRRVTLIGTERWGQGRRTPTVTVTGIER